jgi:hypothetical protein
LRPLSTMPSSPVGCHTLKPLEDMSCVAPTRPIMTEHSTLQPGMTGYLRRRVHVR